MHCRVLVKHLLDMLLSWLGQPAAHKCPLPCYISGTLFVFFWATCSSMQQQTDDAPTLPPRLAMLINACLFQSTSRQHLLDYVSVHNHISPYGCIQMPAGKQ